MMTFVSRRTLPGIRLDLFATFLDGTRHGVEIDRIDTTGEGQEVPARCSGGFGQAAREIQDPALVRSVQAVNLLDNLVFDGLCHNEMNVGKGILDVKGAPQAEGAIGCSASNWNWQGCEIPRSADVAL